MSTPNPELVAALSDASANFDFKAHFENMLKSLTQVLPQESFSYREANYNRPGVGGGD